GGAVPAMALLSVPLAGQLPGRALEVAAVAQQGVGGELSVTGAGLGPAWSLERVGVAGEHGEQVLAVRPFAIARGRGDAPRVLAGAAPVDHLAAAVCAFPAVRRQDFVPARTAPVEIVAGAQARADGLVGVGGPPGLRGDGQVEGPRRGDEDFPFLCGDLRQFGELGARDVVVCAAGLVAGGRAARRERVAPFAARLDERIQARLARLRIGA